MSDLCRICVGSGSDLDRIWVGPGNRRNLVRGGSIYQWGIRIWEGPIHAIGRKSGRLCWILLSSLETPQKRIGNESETDRNGSETHQKRIGTHRKRIRNGSEMDCKTDRKRIGNESETDRIGSETHQKRNGTYQKRMGNGSEIN